MALAGVSLVACGDDDDDSDGNGTPANGTTATATTAGAETPGETATGGDDETAIEDLANEFISALGDQDRTRLRDIVQDAVQDADLDLVHERDREHQYELVEIVDINVDGDTATVTLRLRDKDGEEVERTLDLIRDADQWRVQDPELHE